MAVASFPVPHPAFRRLQYGKAGSDESDEKLGVGLGTRLGWLSQHTVWMSEYSLS